MATVVPMLMPSMRPAATSLRAMAFMMASTGRAGVDGVLATINSPCLIVDADEIGEGAPRINPQPNCHQRSFLPWRTVNSGSIVDPR